MSLNTKRSSSLRAAALVAHKMRAAHPYVLYRFGTMICITGSCDGGHDMGSCAARNSIGNGLALTEEKGRELPDKVYRLDLAWAHKIPWKELMPTDSAGVRRIGPILITPDGTSCLYGYHRILSTSISWNAQSKRTLFLASTVLAASPVTHAVDENSGCSTPASSGIASGCGKGGRGPSGQFGDNHSSFCCMIFREYFDR